MLFVWRLLQLAAKRLMMRLAIQQLGKHDRAPPPPLAAARTDLGMEEWRLRIHADSVNPNSGEAGLSQRQPLDLVRDTIWLPWQSRRSRRGGGGKLRLASRLLRVSFSVSRFFPASPPRAREEWSRDLLGNYSWF